MASSNPQGRYDTAYDLHEKLIETYPAGKPGIDEALVGCDSASLRSTPGPDRSSGDAPWSEVAPKLMAASKKLPAKESLRLA